jgi:hypothetical protein
MQNPLSNVVHLADYRLPAPKIHRAKTPVERFREDKQMIFEAMAQAVNPPSQASRKDQIRQLLEEATTSPRAQILDQRLQSIEEHLLNIQAAICKNGGGHE